MGVGEFLVSQDSQLPFADRTPATGARPVCLLDQPSVRDPKMTIGQLVQANIAKLGEIITIPRFVRFNESTISVGARFRF